MIKVQLKLMFHKKGFIISSLFMYALCLIYYIFVCILSTHQTDSSYICAAQVAFILCALSNGANIVVMIFPIIVLLPFSFSILNDEDIQIGTIYQSRANYTKYYISKVISAFFGSLIIMFFPCLLNLIQVYLTFPTSGRVMEGFYISSSSYTHTIFNMITSSSNTSGIPFASIVFSHPFLYDLVYTLLFSLYAGVVGIFGVSISTVFKPKFKILLFLPYIIVNLTVNRITAAIGKNYLSNPILYVLPNTIGFNWYFFVSYISALMIISILLIWKRINQNYKEGK